MDFKLSIGVLALIIFSLISPAVMAQQQRESGSIDDFITNVETILPYIFDTMTDVVVTGTMTVTDLVVTGTAYINNAEITNENVTNLNVTGDMELTGNLTTPDTVNTEELRITGNKIYTNNYGKYGAYSQLQIEMLNPDVPTWESPRIAFYSSGTSHLWYPSYGAISLGSSTNTNYMWSGLGLRPGTPITDATNSVTVANLQTAYDHSQDNTQAHSDYLINDSDVYFNTVGIGVSDPGNELEIKPSANARGITVRESDDGNDAVRVSAGSADGFIIVYESVSSPETITTFLRGYSQGGAGFESYVNAGGGYFGIGTNTPDDALDVVGTVDVTGDLMVSGKINITGDELEFSDSEMTTSSTYGPGHFVFDGTDDHAQTAADDELDGESDGAFSCWVRHNKTTDYQVHGGYTTSAYGSSNMVFRLNSAGGFDKAWNADSAGWNSIVSDIVISGTDWHHVVYNNDEIWVNGTNSTYTWTQASGGAINDWFDDTYRIGNYNHYFVLGVMDRQVPAHYMNGSLDDCILFSQKLTPAEIAVLYALGRNPDSYATINNIRNRWSADGNSTSDEMAGYDLTLQSGADLYVESNDTALVYDSVFQADGFISDGNVGFTGSCPSGYKPNFNGGVAVGCVPE